MAQAFHHPILPLATAADRRTEIRWGVRDFELRFGRRPAGMWLPETAVDLTTLRLLADEGIDAHDPRAVAGRPSPGMDTRRPTGSTSATAARSWSSLYDAGCPRLCPSSPRRPPTPIAFVRERVAPRLAASRHGRASPARR